MELRRCPQSQCQSPIYETLCVPGRQARSLEFEIQLSCLPAVWPGAHFLHRTGSVHAHVHNCVEDKKKSHVENMQTLTSSPPWAQCLWRSSASCLTPVNGSPGDNHRSLLFQACAMPCPLPTSAFWHQMAVGPHELWGELWAPGKTERFLDRGKGDQVRDYTGLGN